ncbi:MAG: hypothetical protein J6D30_00830 [Clostridia bacterium]|nr:hypothetical protein [Clostridia bacterium]
MGKKKSVVLMTLLTIVMVVLCALTALPTFPIPGTIYDWEPAVLKYDLGKDFGGSYYTYYYPEGVISEAEFESNLMMLADDEKQEYQNSYFKPEGTNLYLDNDPDKNIVIGGQVDAEFEAAVAKAADMIAERVAAFGYSDFRVSVVDKYSVKVELPKDTYAPQALSFLTVMGDLSVESGGTVVEQLQSKEAKVSDYVKGFSVFTRYKVAYMKVHLTKAGKEMVSGLKAGLTASTAASNSSSATTLDFKIGTNTILSVYQDYIGDYNDVEVPLQDASNKAFVDMVQILLTTSLEQGGVDVTFRSLLTSDIRQTKAAFGEDIMTALYIALAIVIAAICVISVLKMGRFGVVNVYMTLSYLIVVGICFGYITPGVFEISLGSLIVFLAGLVLVNVLGARVYNAIKAEFELGKTVESSVKAGFNKTLGATVDVYVVLLLGSIALLFGAAGVYTMALQALICVITAAFCNLLWGRAINYVFLSASQNKYKYFRFVREDDDDE